MFFAMELQTSGVYVSRMRRASVLRVQALYVLARLLRAPSILLLMRQPPQHRQLGSSTDNASSCWFAVPFPSKDIAPSPIRLRPRAPPARPPARTCRGTFARTEHECHRSNLSFNSRAPRPPRPKSADTTHARACRCGTSTRARDPSSFSSAGPADVARPFVSSEHAAAATDTASAYLLFALYARRRQPFLLVCRACHGRLAPSAVSGIRAHSSACCSGRISCPRKLLSPDGALREDHLVDGQIARGQLDAKRDRLRVSYRPLAADNSSFYAYERDDAAVSRPRPQLTAHRCGKELS